MFLLYVKDPLETIHKEEGIFGCYINVRHCGGLSMVLLHVKHPLETIHKEEGISSLFIQGLSQDFHNRVFKLGFQEFRVSKIPD